MVTIEVLNEGHVPAVQAIFLAPEQVKFAQTSQDFLADNNNDCHRFVIVFKGQIVGFFKLVLNYCLTHDFCSPNAIGLRSFVIDQSKQGQGIGTQAVSALGCYFSTHYSQYHCLYLTVNCKNPAAFECYLRGGFQDTGKLYLDGPAGPQRIMFFNPL
ncbi:GNAT family N-acetyltransferase [Psychrobium sp. 1_MG-2023]|uniref:GNAT family N-acetyltransferase n=1 Tax=Psychrobium sp. 1_MG-2023 TaxID=3062624 RepID=UPI000C3240E3|nr:GNAT family N-acetyltransferase [Psychrobium sp. 1_MG-2023]MDP2560611.1 GNAT family N-acetyltransferase [Psychrobium sp. 1_MG-2023]PKF57596.1 GNAT family N-acetyltransferase [Alteromonadales bacterium alter-6D02]